MIPGISNASATRLAFRRKWRRQLGNGKPLPVHLVHNARVQLLATLLNNIALAFMVAGFVAPAVSGQLRAGWHAFITAVWIACGAGLHYAARAVLGRLRE